MITKEKFNIAMSRLKDFLLFVRKRNKLRRKRLQVLPFLGGQNQAVKKMSMWWSRYTLVKMATILNNMRVVKG